MNARVILAVAFACALTVSPTHAQPVLVGSKIPGAPSTPLSVHIAWR